MTKVDFYILPDEHDLQRRLFACRLIEKAFKLGHHVYVHTEDTQQAAELDELLWGFRNNSFIPHQQLAGNSADTPVAIGCSDHPDQHCDVMINLSRQVPAFFSRFKRVTEIVVQDPAITQSTRENYRFYRDRGYPLNSHDMRKH